jgi:hypothetical protein
MTQAPLTARRWKRVEYERLVDLGVFESEPLELIGGQLIVAEPIYRGAGPDPAAPYGWRYRSVVSVAPPADVAPFAFASNHIAVAGLLP